MTAQLEETTAEQAVVHAREQLAASEHEAGDLHAGTAGALGGLHTRGEGETAEAGGI